VCGSSTIELERLAAIQARTVAHFCCELLDHHTPVRLKPDTTHDTYRSD